MKLRFLEATAGWPSLLITFLLYSYPTNAADGAPKVTANKFPQKPMNVEYFKDSDVVLFQDFVANAIYRSENAGEKWDMVTDIPKGEGWDLWMHPVDSKRAFVITRDSTHYMTKDRGKTWQTFKTGMAPSMFRMPLTFHASEPDKVIFNGMDCKNALWCTEETRYTTDGFSTDAKFLKADTAGCFWAKQQDIFESGDKDINEKRIVCIVKGKYSPFKKDYRLLISDSYFRDEFEPHLEAGRTVSGVSNIAMIKKYVVAAAQSAGTDEMALYVSDDTITWHRAVFPQDHKLEEEAYTILESTNYSIQVDVMNSRPSNPMGVMFSSNSNGTFFTRNVEHTNRNFFGLVDFEKVSGIQGIFLVNTVDNHEEIEKNFLADKHILSQITFDDGRTFHNIMTDDGQRLHLHSVTELDNSGKVFSSPAPGIVMGIGNTGDRLKGRDSGETNTYVSDNAGRTWHKALDGPHKYEIGDEGSILLAVRDAKMTDKMSYSLDHGKTWSELTLPHEVIAQELTTTEDSTSQKFILVGVSGTAKEPEHYIMSIDFSSINKRKCGNDDMELWWARVDENNKPTCIMGHKQSYLRRKADADCFVKSEFVDPQVKTDPCECTEADFECDYNFVKDSEGKCILKGPLVIPQGACTAFGSDVDPVFKASSGYRLIPGNDCKRSSGHQKDDLKDWKCSEASAKPASGKIQHTQYVFDGEVGGWGRKIYLERTDSSSGDDETIIMQTNDRKVHITKDHGKTWNRILENADIRSIYTNPYFNDVVYFLTNTKTVHYSTDRGNNIRQFQAKYEPNMGGLPVMKFHPKRKDWFIWTGQRDCDSNGRGLDCHTIAEVTRDRGDNWKTIARYVRKCEFVYDERPSIGKDGRKDENREKLIYCEVRTKEDVTTVDNPWKLVGSSDFFDETTTYFPEIIDFATMNEFIVVASRDEKDNKYMKASASVDGQNFAVAKFPHNFQVEHQQAYTVLDSSTHAVFMHVTVNSGDGFDYGSIIKSNSNGTNYVKSIDGINRDEVGYVDFEKMHGLEGVALVNKAANFDAKDRGSGKKMKTMITHNDGADWSYLTPPATDSENKKFSCNGPIDKCSLHIHSYTEREDKSRIFSSKTAIGLLFGAGNVGEYLGKRSEADTFMSTDAGVTWKMAKKGSYMWRFGDQGSIIVLIDVKHSTSVLYYSRDEGGKWEEYKFSDEPLEVEDFTTMPSDNSRNFLVWAKGPKGTVTVNIDFTGLTNRQCDLDEEKENKDYYFWSPKHPAQETDCLFGHVSQYHRKRTDADCFNGKTIQRLHNIAKNCSCTRADFECDFNYQRKGDGSCELVEGLEPKNHVEECALDTNLQEYWDPTGYRRIPLSTCQGGRELEYTGRLHPCPGKEEEFQKKHGIGPVGIFFAVTIPIAAAAAIGYWVWQNWEGKFGQIRLGEQASYDEEPLYIKYPVVVLSALIAIAQALPLLASSFWRSASTALGRRGGYAGINGGRFGGTSLGGDRRFTTRDSFARGRDNLPVVDEDEGELLGDESDEEVV